MESLVLVVERQKGNTNYFVVHVPAKLSEAIPKMGMFGETDYDYEPTLLGEELKHKLSFIPGVWFDEFRSYSFSLYVGMAFELSEALDQVLGVLACLFKSHEEQGLRLKYMESHCAKPENIGQKNPRNVRKLATMLQKSVEDRDRDEDD